MVGVLLACQWLEDRSDSGGAGALGALCRLWVDGGGGRRARGSWDGFGVVRKVVILFLYVDIRHRKCHFKNEKNQLFV